MKKLFSTLFMLFFITFFSVGCTSTSDFDGNIKDKNVETSKSKDPSSPRGNDKPKEEELTLATIYMSDSDAMNLVNKEVKLKNLTAYSILEHLKSESVITKKTKVISFDEYEDEDLTVAVLNLSSDFYNTNLGSSSETLMLDSVAKTFLENFNLDKLQILVDGNFYESGHIAFDESDYYTLDSFE